MTTSRPASPIAGLILVLSVVVAVIVAQPAPLLGGTASCSYTGTSWDGVNFISNDYYSNLTPAQRAAIEAAMAPCPLTWNGPFSSTASYSCSGGTVGGDVPGGGPPQAATCNVTVMVPTAEPPGSCQTCAQMGYDTGTSPTNYPSCSNGSCRNYTCQDYGYNYGTLGCCYNNANHSDDACYDACPSITGNQPVGYNCSIGQSCTSSANACGQTGSGTIQSNGQCSATTPANPAGYGNSCQSSANSCGMTNTGTIQCNGSCSASAPSNSSCPIDVCSNIGGVQTSVPSGYYASGGACYPNPTDLCDNIAGTQTSVPSGYYQSGSSCYPNPIDVCPTTPGTQTQTSQCNCTDMPSNPGCTVTGPDLTAGSISPAATSPNVSTTFSATITNQGNQTTGSAYNVLFQRATNSSGASATSLGTVSVTTTTAGQSRVASRAASLTQGTWYVRACADMNASMVGAISETNEGNNCGPWTQVVVGSAGSCANPVSVTGSTSGGLWGTNPYTTDSTLGKAAVHAGLLANGQSGTINVADVGTVGSFGGSTRNGVTSTAWPEAYPGMQLSACGPQSDPYPDLTAGAKSPSSATRNQAVTLSATVSNLTNKATNAAGMYVGGPGAGAFYTTFQRATNSSGAGATNITPAHVTGPLAGGASQTASVSYTFTTAGTFYVRACADTPSDNITESNEGNNCGAWSAITVTGTALSCNVSPSSVEVGKSVTYAVSGGSGSYVWQASDGGSYGSASIASRSFAAPGTYGMQVRMGSDGDSWVYCPNVTVAGPACTDAGPVEITASPSRVEQGDTVTLSWTGTNVSGACTVSGGSGSAAVNTSSNPASCTLSGTVTTGAVTTQSTYTVSCPGGQSDTVIVNVIPKFEEF